MIKHDYQMCRKVVRKNPKTFFTAFPTLPRPNRTGIYAIYTFCRLVDDAVNTGPPGCPARLDQLEAEFERFCRGDCQDKFYWRALADTMERFEIDDLTPFTDFIRGKRMDLLRKQYSSLEQLLNYSDCVASSVAIMIWNIISPQRYLRMRPLKQALGRAMQLTKILRDVREDMERGRIYLPSQLMNRAGYSISELHNHQLNQGFIDMWEELAQIAEEYYQMASPVYKHLYPSARLPLRIGVALYKEILQEIRRSDYQVFWRRIDVHQLQMFRVLSQLRT